MKRAITIISVLFFLSIILPPGQRYGYERYIDGFILALLIIDLLTLYRSKDLKVQSILFATLAIAFLCVITTAYSYYDADWHYKGYRLSYFKISMSDECIDLFQDVYGCLLAALLLMQIPLIYFGVRAKIKRKAI
jgi:fucose 4-O-acetylase-like acetyltransferase